MTETQYMTSVSSCVAAEKLLRGEMKPLLKTPLTVCRYYTFNGSFNCCAAAV